MLALIWGHELAFLVPQQRPPGSSDVSPAHPLLLSPFGSLTPKPSEKLILECPCEKGGTLERDGPVQHLCTVGETEDQEEGHGFHKVTQIAPELGLRSAPLSGA